MRKPQMSLQQILFFILAVAIGYGSLLVLIFIAQPGLLYLPNIPSRQLSATPEQVGLAYEAINFDTDDGIRLNAWYLPAEQPLGTLLFFHGNAGNISHRLDSLKIFHELRLNTLIFDYRGYGQSEGKPTEEGTFLDAEAAWRYLREQRHLETQDIIIFGRSLGAAIAAHLASRHKAKALILESAFTSVPDVAATIYPFLPVRWLARFRYNTREYLQNQAAPVLVIHSRDDEIIPFAHGQALFAGAPSPKQFLELRGGHNDGFMLSRRSYVEGLDEFLSEIYRGAVP